MKTNPVTEIKEKFIQIFSPYMEMDNTKPEATIELLSSIEKFSVFLRDYPLQPIEKKQTAVEWFEEQIEKLLPDFIGVWQPEIKQAKEMEKEQMLNLIRFLRTQDKMGKSVNDLYEQYYIETYEKQNT